MEISCVSSVMAGFEYTRHVLHGVDDKHTVLEVTVSVERRLSESESQVFSYKREPESKSELPEV